MVRIGAEIPNEYRSYWELIMNAPPPLAISDDPIRSLLCRWRDDPGSTYQNWFLWDDRLKNFRSIRRGTAVVISEIEGGTFGNVY